MRRRLTVPDVDLRGTALRFIALIARHITWVALIASLLVVYALYGRALGFSFLFDDTFDLTRVEGRSYWQLLASSEGYSYYRPIPFLIWKALRDLQGHYDPATLHALPPIAHAVAGWCLFLLLRRLGAGFWSAVPTLLFLTFPFHYQNIAVVGTLFHPLTGAAMLASLVLYERARSLDAAQTRRGTAWHVAALAATLVALWAHESGVVVAGLIVLLEIVLLWRTRARRPSPWLAGHLLAAVLFFVTWSTVEKAPFGDRTSLDELQPKALFFLQGFTWPLSAQTYWIQDNLGIPGGITVASIGLLDVGFAALAGVFIAYTLAAWRVRRWELVAIPAIGLTIGVAASAPSLWRLSWGYVENSPRLLYLVAIGASIFWGLLPALRFGDERLTRAWRVVTTTLLLLVVIQSWRFIDVRLAMWERGTDMIDGVVATGELYEGRQILVMNAPSWFAQGVYEYPYGHFGVQLMPSYIGLDRVIYTSSERSAEVTAASGALNPDVSGGHYGFGPHGVEMTFEQIDALLREGHELIDVRPVGDRYPVRDIGRIEPGGADAELDLAGQIGEVVLVDDARVSAHDGTLRILIDWHVVAQLDDSVAVIEIRDAGGDGVYTYAGYPLAGFSAPGLWQAGDLIADSIIIPLPDDGEYTIHVGLQPLFTDVPMFATGSDGAAYPDGLLPIGEFVVSASSATVAGSEP